jgi:hypothetical protein
MHFLDTFESFLRHQQLDGRPLGPEVEPVLRTEYERQKSMFMAHDPATLYRTPCKVGEFRYAVAISDGSDSWLTLVTRRAPRGDCYVLIPRDTTPWNPHASYHRDGTYHHKSHDMKLLAQKRQPLEGFKGTEHLGSFFGHGVGTALCEPAAFTSVLTIPTGILEGNRGCVLVDLVEPGVSPAAHHREVPGLRIVREETYRDCTPWVVVAVAAQEPLTA